MSIFDVVTQNIHDEAWSEGEEVVVREPTYGENTKLAKACTGKDGELDSQKFADMLLPLCIVSWTFKRDGEDVPVNLETIRQLPTSCVTFIAEKIGEYIVDADDDFPGDAGAGA